MVPCDEGATVGPSVGPTAVLGTLLLQVGMLSLVTSAREPVKCPQGLHQCESLSQIKCFLPDAVCDGEPDCADGSDERGCESCRPGSLLCEGRCARRCDGVVECADERDEYPCPHCRGGAVLCEQRCVPLCRDPPGQAGCVWRCDGMRECRDGGDEARCFRCGEGGEPGVQDLPCGAERPPRVLGIPRPYHNVTCGRVCDGLEQCDNGWDEEMCPSIPRGPNGPNRRAGH